MQNIPNQPLSNLQSIVKEFLETNDFIAAMKACRKALSVAPNNAEAYELLNQTVNAAANFLGNRLHSAINEAASASQPNDIENKLNSAKQIADELSTIYASAVDICTEALSKIPYSRIINESLSNAFYAVSAIFFATTLRDNPLTDYCSKKLDFMHRIYPLPYLTVLKASDYAASTNYTLPDGISAEYIIVGAPELQFLPVFIDKSDKDDDKKQAAVFDIETKYPELRDHTFAVDLSHCCRLNELSPTFFQCCTGMTYIDLSGCKLEELQNSTFAGCNALADVKLPQCLKKIGGLSFQSTAIAQLDISSTQVTSIADFGFGHVPLIRSIKLPDTLQLIGESAFLQCYSLEKIVFPKNLSTLGNFAFKEATSLREVDMSRCRLAEIPEGAFLSDAALCTVKFPDTPNQITAIHNDAFHNCIKLEKIDNLKFVNFIGRAAFSHCNFKRLNFSYTGRTTILEEAFAYNINLETVLLFGETTIRKYSFRGCDKLTNVSIEEISRESKIDYLAFSGSGLKTVPAPFKFPFLRLENVEIRLPSLDMPEYSSCRCDNSHFRNDMRTVFPNDTVALSETAKLYARKNELQPITEIYKRLKIMDPSVVMLYYDSAVHYLRLAGRALQRGAAGETEARVLFKDALNDINSGMHNVGLYQSKGSGMHTAFAALRRQIPIDMQRQFSPNQGINSNYFTPPLKVSSLCVGDPILFSNPREIIPGLYVAATLPYINHLAEKSKPLVMLSPDLRKIPDGMTVPRETCYIIYGTPELSDLSGFYLSDWQKNHSGVSSHQTAVDLSLCTKLKSIPQNAFAFAKNIISVNLSGCTKLSEIGESAFAGCSSLCTVKFPKAACTRIAPFAFQGSGITELKLAQTSLRTIDTGAFNLCCRLKRAELPEGVCTIDNSAFSMCRMLEQINIPKSVVSLGCYSFYNTGISEIDLSDTNISKIPEGAFDAAIKLQKATLPRSLSDIGRAAFYRCAELKEIIIPHPEKLLSVGEYAFMHSGLKILNLADTHINAVPKCAFSFCRRLQAVALPQSVERICDGGFAECSMLSEINFPQNSKIKSLGAYSFSGCNLEVIDLEAIPIEEISHHAFAGCSGTKRFILPQTLHQIGYSAFTGCSGSAEPIIIPEGLRQFHNRSYSPDSSFCDIRELENLLTNNGLCHSMMFPVRDDAQALNSYLHSGEKPRDTISFSWPLSYKKFYNRAQSLIGRDDMFRQALDDFTIASIVYPSDNTEACIQTIMCRFYIIHYPGTYFRYYSEDALNTSFANMCADLIDSCIRLPETERSRTPIYLTCARIFAEACYLPEAIHHFDRIINANTRENKATADSIYIERARCKYASDHYSHTDTDSDYILAIRANPTGAMPYYERGSYYCALALKSAIDGNQEEAEKLYRTAIAMLNESMAHRDDIPEGDFSSTIDDNVNFNRCYYNSTVKDFCTSALFPNGRTVGSVLMKRAEAYIGIKDYGNAVNDCQEALLSNNHDPLIYVLLADALLGAKRYNDIFVCCEHADAQGIEPVLFAPHCMEAYVAMGNYERAMSVYSDTVSEFRDVALAPSDNYILGRVSVLQSLAYFSTKQYTLAAQLANSAIKYCSDYSDCVSHDFDHNTLVNIRSIVLAHLIHAKSNLNTQSSAGVIEDCEQILKYCPDYTEIPILRGTAHLINQDYVNAISDFSTAILNNPFNTDLSLMRAAAYIGNYNYDSAIDDCNVAIRSNMSAVEPFVTRAKAYIGKGAFDNAVFDCSIAISNNQSYAAAFTVRAEARLNMHDYDAALADCRSAADLNGNTVENMLISAKAHLGKRDANSALTCCNKILDAFPDNKDALSIRADICHNTHDYTQFRLSKDYTELCPGYETTIQQIHLIQLMAQQTAAQINNHPEAMPPILQKQPLQNQTGNLPAQQMNRQNVQSNRQKTAYGNFADEQQGHGKSNPTGNYSAGCSNAKNQSCNTQFGRK